MLSDCSELYCVPYCINGFLNNLISLVPDGPLQPPPPPAPAPSPAPSQNTVPTAAPPPNPPQNPPNGQGGQQQQQPLNPAIIGKTYTTLHLMAFHRYHNKTTQHYILWLFIGIIIRLYTTLALWLFLGIIGKTMFRLIAFHSRGGYRILERGRSRELKCGTFLCMHVILFPLYKVWESPYRQTPGPRLDPPLHNILPVFLKGNVITKYEQRGPQNWGEPLWVCPI